MQKILNLKLLPSEAADETAIKNYIAAAEGQKQKAISGFTILKRSIDARGKQAWINLSLQAFINEPFQKRSLLSFDFKDVRHSKKQVLIIGAGPAGLFAA